MSELTVNQEKAIELILAGQNQKETAKSVGVTARTVRGWMAKPAFSEALEAGREELRQEWRVKRRQLLGKTFNLLDEALETIDVTAQEQDIVKLANAVAKMSDQIRTEYGDLPTKKAEIGVSGGAGKKPLILVDGELWEAI